MLKRLIFVVVIGLFLAQMPLVFALDWQALHERADRITLEEAQEVFSQNPDSLDALYILALVYLNGHQDKQADGAFQQMLKIQPRSTEARWGRAEVLRRRRSLAESERMLNELMESDPEFFPAYISLAYLKYTRLDFKESVNLAYQVKRQGRDKVDLSNYVRAYLLIAGGKGMLAYYGGPLAKVINGTAVLPNLKKAERLQPDSPAVLFGLGSFYFLSPAIIGGNLNKAEGYLKQAIEVDPLFADAYVRLAQVYRMKGEAARYEALLGKALEIDPENELARDAQSGKCAFICISVKE
jgi:tetratricopeptide (TPR) repeat protein